MSEQEGQIKIMVVVLAMHERSGWVCPYLCEWLTNLKYNNNYATHVAYARNFIPAAAARNYIGRHINRIEPKPDWLLMIDNDMAPEDNLLDAVKGAPEDADIIVPQFSMWDENKPSITLCWGMDPNTTGVQKDGKQLFTIEQGKFYPLTKAGTGAIFIRPSVFEKIDMPYFWYTWNADQGLEGTEDINFSKKCLAAGLKIYGTGSVTVGHYHNVNLAVLSRMLYGNDKSSGANEGVPSQAPVGETGHSESSVCPTESRYTPASV